MIDEQFKKDLNGFGQRLTDLDKEFTACRSAKKIQIENLEKLAEGTRTHFKLVHDKLDKTKADMAKDNLDLKLQVQKIAVRLGVVICILVFLANVFSRYLPFGKKQEARNKVMEKILIELTKKDK